MSCERYDPDLALYVEGDLRGPEALQLTRHLEDCARCRAFLAALADSQRGLKDLAAEPVDDIALAAVRARVLAAVRERSVPARTTSGLGWALGATRWRWSLAAALAVAASGVGALWWTRPEARRPHVEGPATAAHDVSPSNIPKADATQEIRAKGDGTRDSTARGVRTVSRGRAGATGQAIPSLSPEEADQLARAIVALSEIRRLSDVEKPAGEPPVAGQVVLATSDPDVVIYWQLDSNGG